MGEHQIRGITKTLEEHNSRLIKIEDHEPQTMIMSTQSMANLQVTT